MTGIFALKLCIYLCRGKALYLNNIPFRFWGVAVVSWHCFWYIFHRPGLFWFGYSSWGTSLSPQDSSCMC